MANSNFPRGGSISKAISPTASAGPVLRMSRRPMPLLVHRLSFGHSSQMPTTLCGSSIAILTILAMAL